jgi:GNAT superfamily N-acetyltransferase
MTAGNATSGTLIRLRPGVLDDVDFLVEIIDMSSHGGIGEHYHAVYGRAEPWQSHARRDISCSGSELGYDMAVVALAGDRRAAAAIFNPLRAHIPQVPAQTERSAAIQRLIGRVPGTLLIREVAVLPRYRGQGIGRKLIEAAIAFARYRKLSAVSLTVNGDNTPARALYETSGFIEIGSERIDGQQIFVMQLLV